MSNSIKNISKIFIVIITLGALNIVSSNAAETISPRVPAKRLVPYSPESISEGKKLFTLHCKACHGTDGKSKIDFISDATDLTDPTRWHNGTSEQEIYISLTEGAGFDMPPFKYKLTDEKQYWHLINWITSNWTKEQRDILLKKKLSETSNIHNK